MPTEQEKIAKRDSGLLAIVFAILFIIFILNSKLSADWRMVFCFQIGLCLIAARIGKDRKIGFGKAFFVSFFLTPLIGFVIIFNSTKIKDEEYKDKMLEYAGEKAQAVSVAEELGKLNELRKAGIITDEEFAAQKDKLLNS